ncbi:MAG TPA: lipid-binding SYLF domain-containing protein [Polyangia bacterium]|jgi:lipid-binding SYLF domain-containing protein
MKKALGCFAVAGLFIIACAHAPTKPGERADLVTDAHKTIQKMEATDPGIRRLLDDSIAYVVFPSVGEGGFIVGAGAGSGVVFEHGRHTGFAEVSHASVGALAGGQRYAELVIIKDPAALEALKSGRFDVGAKAQAVILRSGASTNTTFDKGVAVFVDPLRGGMVNASITGQRIKLTM